MSHLQQPAPTTEFEPLPDNIRSVQPGGGVCYRIELEWGRLRRWYLRRFRPGYVQWMAQLRLGDASGAPHEILDPRDLKYCRNVCGCHWRAADDPFAWREAIPLARWGLAEVQLMGYPLAALAALCVVFYPALAPLPAAALALVVYFFRDPPRPVPQTDGLFVSPADGRVAEITPLEHDPYVGGAAVKIGIFLSIFNVHVNRLSDAARVVRLHYEPGEFRNALDPRSATVNESMWIGCESVGPPARRFAIRQIAGQWARRIVCDLRPGEVLPRGHRFGMIKLGSRTELILPVEPGLQVAVEVGQKVHGGLTVLARYET